MRCYNKVQGKVYYFAVDTNQPVASTVVAKALTAMQTGKPLGIVLACWLAISAGVARLPAGVSWRQIAGGGVLCGIGFTMALFIANLALEGPALAAAKVGILEGSALAAVAGMVMLWFAAGPPAEVNALQGIGDDGPQPPSGQKA